MKQLKHILFTIFAFVKPFGRAALTTAGPVLAQAAADAVAVSAESLADGSGRMKREHAYRLISKDLRRQGIAIGADVTSNMINTAIEVAVANLKDK